MNHEIHGPHERVVLFIASIYVYQTLSWFPSCLLTFLRTCRSRPRRRNHRRAFAAWRDRENRRPAVHRISDAIGHETRFVADHRPDRQADDAVLAHRGQAATQPRPSAPSLALVLAWQRQWHRLLDRAAGQQEQNGKGQDRQHRPPRLHEDQERPRGRDRRLRRLAQSQRQESLRGRAAACLRHRRRLALDRLRHHDSGQRRPVEVRRHERGHVWPPRARFHPRRLQKRRPDRQQPRPESARKPAGASRPNGSITTARWTARRSVSPS